MPPDQVAMTLYDLNRDATRWRRTLSQIEPAADNLGFLLDMQLRALIHDANESLDDIEKATAEAGKSPRVAETIAIAFDLSRLHETVIDISSLTVMAHNSKDGVTAATASPTLRANKEGWQQIAKTVANEVRPYRNGWESYTFHLGQVIDNSLSK